MGRTSQTYYIDSITSQAFLNHSFKVVEASQIGFFRKSVNELRKLFSTIEVFDNGEVTLKNYLGDFVTLQKN